MNTLNNVVVLNFWSKIIITKFEIFMSLSILQSGDGDQDKIHSPSLSYSLILVTGKSTI